MQIATRYGINNKKLVHVIGEMEHTEPPLSTWPWLTRSVPPGASWNACFACI